MHEINERNNVPFCIFFIFMLSFIFIFIFYIVFVLHVKCICQWVTCSLLSWDCILVECCESCASRFFPPHCSVSYIRFYFRATLSASLSRYRLIEEMYTEPETFNQDRIREYSAENISLGDLYLESAHRKEDFIFRLVGNRLIF